MNRCFLLQNVTFDRDAAGVTLGNSPGAPKPAAVYEFKDQSTVFLNIRAQRNF
jgi:hypothetical protein